MMLIFLGLASLTVLSFAEEQNPDSVSGATKPETTWSKLKEDLFGNIARLGDENFYYKTEGRLVFVLFCTDRSRTCIDYARTFSETATILEKYMFVQVDLDDNKTLAAGFGKESRIAAVINGTEIRRYDGPARSRPLRTWCNKLIKEVYPN